MHKYYMEGRHIYNIMNKNKLLICRVLYMFAGEIALYYDALGEERI